MNWIAALAIHLSMGLLFVVSIRHTFCLLFSSVCLSVNRLAPVECRLNWISLRNKNVKVFFCFYTPFLNHPGSLSLIAVALDRDWKVDISSDGRIEKKCELVISSWNKTAWRHTHTVASKVFSTNLISFYYLITKLWKAREEHRNQTCQNEVISCQLNKWMKV